MTTLPPVVSLERFARERGDLTTDAAVWSHIHAGLRSAPTTKTYKRWNEATYARLSAERDQTVRLYRAAVEAGEIRDPADLPHLERLRATAAGHPDNQSVQAARRLLAKKLAALG